MKFGRRTLAGVVVVLAGVAASSSAYAWGTDGHQVVALIAQSQLTPKTRAEVARLLALEPGQTLLSISTWADEHRNPSTAAWHYVNFPRTTCHYEPERDCPGGKCVVGAIERQLSVLGSNADDATRLMALKYVVHFVADVHQPLHSGFADDRGGNKYQIQVLKRGSNLHTLWDSGLIKRLNQDADKMATRVRGLPVEMSATNLDPAVAAEESCRNVSMPGFYPKRKVSTDYFDQFTPVVERRLALAGARLAGQLNATFK